MPYKLRDLNIDSHFTANSHIVNQSFSKKPKYSLAFSNDTAKGILIISSLYVFPSYRGNQLGTKLIDYLKKKIPVEKGVILQLCISKTQKGKLHDYYSNQGFTTTGIANSEGLIDYFWWYKELKLAMSPNNASVIVERIQ